MHSPNVLGSYFPMSHELLLWFPLSQKVPLQLLCFLWVYESPHSIRITFCTSAVISLSKGNLAVAVQLREMKAPSSVTYNRQ